MEKSVTLRFYSVERVASDRPALADVIKKIGGKPIGERGRNVTGEEIFVRLENYNEHEGCVEGQFVRGQSGNRPGRMLIDGTADLPFEEQIGHGVAFRYRPTDGLLAIEYNPQVLAPSRVMAYIYEFEPRAEFRLLPRMREDAWERFEAYPLRKMTISIAGNPDVAAADDDNNATWANLSEMSERYGAHSLKVEIGMGHRKGVLTEAAKSFVRDAFGRLGRGEEDIRKLTGTIETGEGQPNDEINLIGELFDVKEALSFPENKWERFYTLRRNLLRTKLNLL